MENQIRIPFKIDENNVKPRFDGKGSEFGLLHRKLGPQFGMFDIDSIEATSVMKLELSESDVGFFEYRTNFSDSSIEFKAFYEIKYKMTIYVEEAMKCRIGSATWAQLKLCELIGARYFIVVSTNGIQPFTFYEYRNIDGILHHKNIGILNYINREIDGKIAIESFWKNNLRLS